MIQMMVVEAHVGVIKLTSRDDCQELSSSGSLLNQLAIANENLGGGIVVVMAERDKEEMELDIAKMEFDFRGTSVICRSGSPLILADIKKV
ncbi:hypothetical protein IEQ34_009360 [Dendrobium chrysotoxum]|uniref:Uncharacterized protein n=1 Tax=Dendrobium chrysotoxum TaxID=161865 RepID=A0AAV7H0G9_DENCH|nr:hypothetical protein IEQ34_009360 [Dendrobium chrysotoxum]